VRVDGHENVPLAGRRGVLRLAMTLPLLAVAGCAGGPRPPDRDQRLRAHALVGTRALISAYETAMARSPGSRGWLAPVLAEHRRHLAVLVVGVPSAAEASPSPARTSTEPPPGARSAAELYSWFASHESTASAGHAHDVLAAPGDLARLLSSVAACEASLAGLLAAGRPPAVPGVPSTVAGSGKATPAKPAPSARPAVSASATPTLAHVSGALAPGNALQRALAAEHAAVYGYGIVGARLSGAARVTATADFQAHRARRDQLIQLIASRHQTPVAAAPAYALPFAVTSSAEAARLAAYLEDRVAGVYADLVAVASGSTRQLASTGVRDAAVNAASWSGTSPPFPGVAELN
jgi:hypothetical protein